MANNTLRNICYDIQTDLKQTTDDADIPLSKIAFHTLMVANRLKSQHISKINSGAFLHTFPEVKVIKSANNNTKDLVKNRPCIFLPKSIYDFDLDKGVEYISYSSEDECEECPPKFTKVTFTRTFAGQKAKRLYQSKYEKPSPKNPYWYRSGDYIYLLGLECVDVDYVEIGIYSVFDPITEIDIDAPFDFPEELLPVLKRQVLDLGRFILMIPSERVNDGDDSVNKTDMPTQKLISVNEQAGNGQQ